MEVLARGVAFLALGLAACGAEPSATRGPEFTVAAAASLTDVIDEALAIWNEEHGHRGRGSYAASSTLARAIEQGAPYDVFISADRLWMRHLVDRERVETTGLCFLARNELVLVGSPGFRPELDSSLGDPPTSLRGRRWTTGDPEHVPLGRYAREALGSLGWWEELEPELLTAGSARAALRLVERGEVDWGVVYGSDLGARQAELHSLLVVPGSAHLDVAYPAATTAATTVATTAATTAEARAEARDFLRWLAGPRGRALFASHGFQPPLGLESL